METKETIVEKLQKREDAISRHIIDEVRGIIYCIQKTWHLTDTELAELFDRDEDYIDSVLHNDYDDIRMDFTFLARLMDLSLGVYKIPGVDVTDEGKSFVTKLLHQYCGIVHKPKKTKDEMVNELLKNMGINNDEDIENAYYNMQYMEETETDKNGNKNHNVKGKYFDSNKMDKPKTFSFDLNNLKDSEEFKSLMNELGGIASNIFGKHIK